MREDKNKTQQDQTQEAGKAQEMEQKDGGKLKRKITFISDSIEDEIALKQWKRAIEQVSLNGEWLKKQLPLALMILVGIIAYITFRYEAQQEIILEEQLLLELQDWKYRTVTRSSELTLKTRQSQIEGALKAFGDSTLKVSNVAPFTISKAGGHE